MLRLRKCEWCQIVMAGICIIFSIVTWVTFPIIYPSMVKKNLVFEQHKDMSYGFSAFELANPPMINIMRFYFFNITNPDEMIYQAATPQLVETGAFAVIESEHKKYMKWNDDGTQVFYQNFKKYIISEEHSCSTCDFQQMVTIPNPTEIGANADMYDPRYGVTPSGRRIIATALLFLGEYPFVTHTVREILFDGYNDALLSAAHSNFIATLSKIINGPDAGPVSIIPIPVPDFRTMGFFQGYNNSNDEWYWIKTGKDDIDRLGEVVTWADQTKLPNWWNDDYANSIRGSDSGSFVKMHPKEGDTLPFFQSFMCRSFDTTYLNETIVHNIPSNTFSVPYEQFDSTMPQNVGFRYRNVEKINYYPDWPACPDRDPSKCSLSEPRVDCSAKANLCHDCCNGSFVNGTYLIPPGLFPLVCMPGKLQPTPFSIMYSAPHFVYSPQSVVNSVVGLNPNIEIHNPFVYNHEKYSGTVTEVFFRIMINMPVAQSPVSVSNMHLPNRIVPIFWQDAHATLTQGTYDKLYLGFVFVPKFVNVLKYFLIALALFLVALVALCSLRRSRKVNKKDKQSTVMSSIEDLPSLGEDEKEEAMLY